MKLSEQVDPVREGARHLVFQRLRQFSAALSVALLCTFAQSEAEPVAPPEAGSTMTFSIPPQPLVTAVETFGETTKAQIVYDASVVAGRQSSGVSGSHTPSEALEILLSGTGVEGGYQGSNTVFLVLNPAELPTPQSAAYMADQRQVVALDTLRVEALPTPEFFFQSYVLLVENGVKRALTLKDESVRRPLRIKVWVDANGTIRQSALYVSSGDQKTDAYVLRRLQGLALQTPPPAGFPNPVFIRIFE